MRSSKNVLIFNGNITTPVRYKKSTFIVNNTCAFDSVVFAIGISYTDHFNYKNYIDESNNRFLNFIKDLSCHGSTDKCIGKELYYYRKYSRLTQAFKN